MKRYIHIILILLFIFLYPLQNRQINNSEFQEIATILDNKIFLLDKLNNTALVKDDYSPSALEDLKLGHRLLLGRMSQNEIIKHKIKSSKQEGMYIEKFDKKGYKIFEKWDAWYAGSAFKYEFDKDEKPLTISMLDTNNVVIGTAKYKYNRQGKLLNVGVYKLKYYPNGLLKSIEDNHEIERYEYDKNGNLNHIHFDWQPGVVGCGNRATEWRGEYNDRKQLIKEDIFGIDATTRHFEYTQNGQIAKTINNSQLKHKTITEFTYVDGLLTQTRTIDSLGNLKYNTKWIYEKYE